MKHKVMIMKCEDYDPEKVAGIVKECMSELGVKPKGKTMIKPNTVIAHKGIFPYAFTRKEVVEGILKACREKGDEITELSVGERCGITVPTRYVFKEADYLPVIKKYNARPYYFDECKQVPVKLKSPHALRDEIYTPKPVAECDFLINAPKFKAHPWTRLTLGLKNYIGIQDDRHRLVDHNTFLEHKIADLQEIIQPGLIVIDGIVAGQKMMITPTPFDMGALVIGVNPCAVDTVGCHMVHVEPKDLIHLKIASERGLGPMSLDEIELAGDYPLDEVRAKTENFEFCLERIDSYFQDSENLRCTVGKFPESHSPDYCWGGCPGALQETMHIYRGFYPDIEKRMGKIHYVVGDIEQPLDIREGETVIFAGDCTKYKGSLNGDQAHIEGDYKTTDQVDAANPPTNDMVVKILGGMAHAWSNKLSKHIHIKGCPVSVAKHITYLSVFAKIPDVNFDTRYVFKVNLAYMQMRVARAWNRLFG